MGGVSRKADPAAIAEAAQILQAGGLVAFPTETVYGLGADATNPTAVARIFEAKQRPAFNPLIVHVADTEAAGRIVEMDDRAHRLAARFWPGALTLVLQRAPDSPICPLATAGLDTVAIRVPAGETAQALLAAADLPIAAPSANRSGSISPTTAAHVVRSLGGAVDMILDGGPCALGVESTIVDLSDDATALLRPGGVPAEAIEEVTGPLVAPALEGAPRAPGQLASHYAPRTKLRIGTEIGADEALLAFGPDVPAGAARTLNLSPSGDLVEAAANLFAMLHTLDEGGHAAIVAMDVPETGLGLAIMDRLRRAAAPIAQRPDRD